MLVNDLTRCGFVMLILLSSLMLVDGVPRAKRHQFGTLKLCPSGGQTFMMAWSLACEVKRKKREVSYDFDGNTNKRSVSEALNGYRPATLTEIMNICCHLGCEIRDLLTYCDPFGAYNS